MDGCGAIVNLVMKLEGQLFRRCVVKSDRSYEAEAGPPARARPHWGRSLSAIHGRSHGFDDLTGTTSCGLIRSKRCTSF